MTSPSDVDVLKKDVSKARIIYAVWNGSVVFAKHPHLRGLYLKTHPCVMFVACSACKVRAGEPCVNAKGSPKSETHYLRRNAYAKKQGRKG